jgi:serralysin
MPLPRPLLPISLGLLFLLQPAPPDSCGPIAASGTQPLRCATGGKIFFIGPLVTSDHPMKAAGAGGTRQEQGREAARKASPFVNAMTASPDRCGNAISGRPVAANTLNGVLTNCKNRIFFTYSDDRGGAKEQRIVYLTATGKELPLSGASQNWVAGATANYQTRYGTSSNDVFYSRYGDTLAGGAGDDIYNLWDSFSKVTEGTGGGVDTVYAYYWGPATLSANVENLFLMGQGSTAGTGNALGNIIVAGDTHATLDGLGGDDVLVGGKGADVFNVSAGSGSDAILNFQHHFDVIRLNGYGLTSFDQLKALGSQTGADVTFSFANGEKLVVRDTNLSDLDGYDFNLPQALTAPAGFTLQSGSGRAYTANGWYVLNNAWGASGLTEGKDFTISSAYNKADLTGGTQFSWSFPLSTEVTQPIKAYPEVIFGVSPYGNVYNSTDKANVFPLQVSDIVSLTADYDITHSGNSGGYNVAYDIWLTSVPHGDGSTVTNEVMVWLHKGDFPPFGDVVGTYADGDFTATVYHTGTYTAVVADHDRNAGSLDVAHLLSALGTMGIVSSNEYLAAIELGSEVTSGSGQLTINNLDITVQQKGDNGTVIQKVVTGAGTTVTDVTPVAEVPQDDVTAPLPVNHAPEFAGYVDTAALSVAEGTKAVATLAATDADAGTVLHYSIAGGADAALFDIDAATGALAFKAAPDFEQPADTGGDNRYDVVVRADDGSLYRDLAVAVGVTNVNEAPVVAATTASLSVIQSKASVVTAIGATDPDGDVLRYAIKDGAGPGKGTVTFDATNGTYVYHAADFAVGDDSFTIQISDGHGGLTEQAVSVSIGERIDTLTGTDGRDWLNGGKWTDHIWGGAGNDMIYGGAGDDELHGGVGDDMIGGDDGNDILYGEDGNDTLQGAAGDDRLYGGAGNDTLNGGAGNDYMEGGTGNDYYYVYDAGDVVVERPGEGTDTVQTTLSTYRLPENVENLIYYGGGITGTGNALDNVMTGSGGNDSFHGGGGNDALYGGDGSDTLYGEDGDDALNGGNGDDVLVGGAGADKLYGGGGADRFVFLSVADSTAASPDHISDFWRAQGDRIDLRAIDARVGTDADDAFAFIGSLAFTGVAGQLRYQTENNHAVIYGDVNGDGIADFVLHVDNVPAMTTSDFYL